MTLLAAQTNGAFPVPFAWGIILTCVLVVFNVVLVGAYRGEFLGTVKSHHVRSLIIFS